MESGVHISPSLSFFWNNNNSKANGSSGEEAIENVKQSPEI